MIAILLCFVMQDWFASCEDLQARFKTYAEAREFALEKELPLLVMVTGEQCIACDQLKEDLKLWKNEFGRHVFVIVPLDDAKKLKIVEKGPAPQLALYNQGRRASVVGRVAKETIRKLFK